MLKIAVSGITGRIGALISELISKNADLELAQGLTRLSASDGLSPTVEIFIDFSVPEATVMYAELCVKKGIPLVTGTTGLSLAQQKFIEDASKRIPILQAANMSLGINMLYALVAQAQKMSKGSYDIQIIEAHRKEKRDAPSGTALQLRRALESISPEQSIDITSIRVGELCEHQVWMVGPHERLELNHQAFDRRVFAEGAIEAARWLSTQKPGLYSMQDVLGL